MNSIADTPQSVGGATNTLSRSGAILKPPPPQVVLYVGSGHGYITIAPLIMACLQFRYDHLEIAEPSCGTDNDVSRASNRDKESKHTITVRSLFLFV